MSSTLVSASVLICVWLSSVNIALGEMPCSSPPCISNGWYTLDKGASNKPIIHSKATYSCDVGYQLANDTVSTLTCELDPDTSVVKWMGEIPHCLRSCSDPDTSVNGKREGNCCFVGDIVKFSCNEDFELIGKDTLKCLSTGLWSSRRPLCRPLSDYCEHPPVIPHGAVKGDKEGDYYRPYDKIEILCEPGYKYQGGSEYVLCKEEGAWEEDFGECVEAFCDPPEPLANGAILELISTNSTTFPFNFELTYICEKGFRLIGDSWRYCDGNGWSGGTPYCEVVKCPDPGVPEHAKRQGDRFQFGDKVVFNCFTGYELLGSFERYCQSNGEWSGQLTSCDTETNYCPDPGTPISGMKNSDIYDMGVKINFLCYSGFTLLESEVRECLSNRTWSGKEARCISQYDFDDTAEVRFLKAAVAKKVVAQKKKLREYRETQFLTLRCGTGLKGRLNDPFILDFHYRGKLLFYFVFDVSESEYNFLESVDLAKIHVKRIEISENEAKAAALTFNSEAEIQFIPFEFNTTHELLAALDSLHYTDFSKCGQDKDRHAKRMPWSWIDINGKRIKIFRFIKNENGHYIVNYDGDTPLYPFYKDGRPGFPRDENRKEVYAFARNGGMVYPKDLDGNEHYIGMGTAPEFAVDSEGKAYYARMKTRDNEEVEYAPTNSEGEPVYIRDGSKPVCPMDFSGNIVVYPTDPNTNEQMYFRDANGQEFYCLDRMNDEVYALNAEGSEKLIKDNVNKPVYARSHDGGEKYPKKADGSEYYAFYNNTEFFAHGKDGEEYYAKDEYGDEFYPRRYG